MPRAPRRSEARLERALEALCDALGATRAPWMIIGGVALIARGVRRMTADVDACVRGDAITVPALIASLATEEIVPRMPNAAAFAQANLVLLMRHAPTGVDLDISLAWSAFEHAALAASTATAFGRVTAPMASAEALVVFKAIAARPKDLEDVAALLALHPRIRIRRVRTLVVELAELAGEPAMVETLDRAIAEARRARKPAPRRRPKRG